MKKRIQSITYTCKHCGKEYHPKDKERKTYCSRECAFADKADKAVKQKKENYLICAICGNRFVGRANTKYCSEDCKNINNRTKWRSYYKPREKIIKACERCNKEYVANKINQLYCSDCAKEADKMHKGKVSKAKRLRIYERDNYVCQLCGEPLRMDKLSTLGSPSPHPKTPTVDHILPVSVATQMGWSSLDIHKESNLRAAHYACNSSRGNTLDGHTQLAGPRG